MIVIGAIEDLSYTNLLALQHQLSTLCEKVCNTMMRKFGKGTYNRNAMNLMV